MAGYRAIVLSTLLLPLLLMTTACSIVVNDQQAVRGSGTVITETRDVQGFNEVELHGIGTLTIEQGSREALRIEAEDNLVPLIVTEIEGDRLVIRWRQGTALLAPTQPIRFFLSLREIDRIRLAGLGDISANTIRSDDLALIVDGSGRIQIDVLTADKLTVEIDGLGNIESAGTVNRQEIEIQGSGNYQASDLQSRQASIEIDGLGNALIRVSDQLDVKINGSGNVRYTGDPQVTQDIDGLGRVIKQN